MTDDQFSLVSQTPRYWYRPTKVSRRFRDLVLSTFKIEEKTRYGQTTLRLLDYLMFDGRREKETGWILAPCEVIAALCNESSQKNVHVGILLGRFSREIHPLKISGWSRAEKRCRTIEPPNWPPPLQEALRKELEAVPEQGLVYFDSGKQVSRRAQAREKKEHIDLLKQMAEMNVSDSSPAGELAGLLNSQSTRIIEKLWKKNRPAVRTAIASMPHVSEKEQSRYDYGLATAKRIDDTCRHLYISAKKTPRVFATGTSINQLPREIRNVALSGCYTIDMCSCQLAIISQLWGIPRIKAFLASDKSIWAELAEKMELPQTEAIKAAIKNALYSSVFGMGKRKTKTILASELEKIGYSIADAKAAALCFGQHPMIRSVYQSRKREQSRILLERGSYDAFGIWSPLEYDKRNKPTNLLTVMTYTVQSYELKIMLAAFPILKSESALHVVSWLHDGFTVFCGDKRQAERQIRRLECSLTKQALEMGIPTSAGVSQLI